MHPKPIVTLLLTLSVFLFVSGASAAPDLPGTLQPETHSWFCAESDTKQKKKKQKEAEGEEEPDCE